MVSKHWEREIEVLLNHARLHHLTLQNLQNLVHKALVVIVIAVYLEMLYMPILSQSLCRMPQILNLTSNREVQVALTLPQTPLETQLNFSLVMSQLQFREVRVEE